MTLEREGRNGVFVCECDSCKDVLETNTRDFETAREVIQEANWSTEREEDGWTHSCPTCRQELLESLAHV